MDLIEFGLREGYFTQDDSGQLIDKRRQDCYMNTIDQLKAAYQTMLNADKKRASENKRKGK